MKRSFISLLLCVISLHVFCQNPPSTNGIEWEVGRTQPLSGGKPVPKSPEQIPETPEATLEGNVLTFISSHDDYTLTLIDADDEVAYEVTVPSTVSVVILPATLTGDYELQLDYGGNYYFYCDIEL